MLNGNPSRSVGDIRPVGAPCVPLAFTCLLPVYHRDDPGALELAIDSVANSTLPPTTILLCIDGHLPSPLERTVLAAQDAYAARIVVNPGANGLHHNLNNAMSHVTTPWVARMDADDICLPDRFARQFRFLGENPDIDVLGGATVEIWPGGRSQVKTVPLTHEEILRSSLWRNPLNHQTAIFRRATFESLGPYPNLVQKEDYGLWLMMLAGGARFANLPDRLVNVSLGEDYYERRAGLKNISSEWGIYKIKRSLRQFGLLKPLISTIVRGGSLSMSGPARLIYTRFLR